MQTLKIINDNVKKISQTNTLLDILNKETKERKLINEN